LDTAIKILTSLAEEKPDVFEYRRLLALCHRERSRDNFSADVDTAIAILERLVEQFPDVQDLRYDLSQTYAMVRTRRSRTEDRDRVEQRLRAALAQASELDTSVPAYLLLRVHVHSRLAALLQRDTDGQSRTPEAAEHLRQALELHNLLPEKMVNNPFFRGSRARLQTSLADLLLATGEPDDRAAAVELYSQAKTELERVLVEFPDNRFLRKAVDDLRKRLDSLFGQPR
jgi:tetratricopeptide (TPR) repeat protein